MKRVFTVAIPDDIADLLQELSDAEYRRPKDQAAVLLIEAIRQRSDREHEPEPVAAR